jgi:hypothetical protein
MMWGRVLSYPVSAISSAMQLSVVPCYLLFMRLPGKKIYKVADEGVISCYGVSCFVHIVAKSGLPV